MLPAMKLAVVFVLVASTAWAKDTAKACDPAAPVLIEVRTIDLSASTTHVTTLHVSGAWAAHDLDKAKKESHAVTGCAKDVEPVVKALAKSKWTVTKAKVKCMAVATSQTEYVIQNKVVWTAKLCSGDILDADSAAAVDLIDQTIASLR